ERLRVGRHEVEVRVLFLRTGDQPRRDVHAPAVARAQRRQEIAGAAAELQHARALGHYEAREALERGVVRAVLGPPLVALVGEAVVLLDAAAALVALAQLKLARSHPGRRSF